MIPQVLEVLANLGVRQKDVAAALRVRPQVVNDWYRGKRPIPPGQMEDLWALAALVRSRREAGISARDACGDFHAIRLGPRGHSVQVPIPGDMLPDWKAALEATDLSATLFPIDLFQLSSTLRSLEPYLHRQPETLTVEELEAIRQAANGLRSTVTSLQHQFAVREPGGGDASIRESSNQRSG
jgi:hypothetical protein